MSPWLGQRLGRLSGCRILPFPVRLHPPASVVAAGRGAAGPPLRPAPSPTSAAGRGTAGAKGHGITSCPSAMSPCHPVGLFGTSFSPSPARWQPWHLTRPLARLFEMNKREVPMETRPSRCIGALRALHSLFRLQHNVFSTTF